MLRDALLFLVVCAVLTISAVIFTHIVHADSMTSLLERRFQVSPGQTRVLPECGCTVRYVGTYVHGHRYTVIIDKLD